VSQPIIQAPKACAAVLVTVDQDIDVAKRSIVTRRTTLVNLPAKTIVHIFHFSPFSKRPYFRTLMPSSVYFTHVCRRWFSISSSQNKDWAIERLSHCSASTKRAREFVGKAETE
jgi:hypothetical protein